MLLSVAETGIDGAFFERRHGVVHLRFDYNAPALMNGAGLAARIKRTRFNDADRAVCS